MTKPANIEGIETATNITWKKWLSFFDSIGAKNLSHPEIAQKAYDKMFETQASRGWWSQSVAVAYEQHIGRRQPGQRSDGTYEVTLSKTFTGNMDEAMQAWVDLVGDTTEFSDIPISGEPSSTDTEKWRHWRVGLNDGTKVNVDTTANGADKATLTVTNTKLKDIKDVERWRLFWKEFLKNLRT